MKPKTAKNTEPVVINPSSGRDEMNLAEFPTTLLSDHVPEGVKTLRFEAGQGGLLTVTGSDAYGLPTASDADVLIGLIQLTKLRSNFTESKVPFTRYELLRLLNWTNAGSSYQRLDQSLNRWMGVTLVYENCWYDNRAKKVGSAKMHIIESVVLVDGTGENDANGTPGSQPLSYFTWNKTFIQSCQADNLKRLDLEDYFSLRGAISKRIYRFLDKKFYRKNTIEFDLREFALERVGLSRGYARNAGKIKEKLKAAFEELEAIGFLEPLPEDVRYRREGRNWIVRLSRATTPALPAPRIVTASEEPPLLGQLVDRGVTRAKAAGLVRDFPTGHVEAKIEILDWLVEKKDKRVAKNPAGWLVKAVEDDYPSPKGFESKADRQRNAETKAAVEREAAEERRRKREAAARARELADQVTAYRNALTPDQLRQVEVEALAQASEETRRNLDAPLNKPFRKSLLSMVVNDHIGRMMVAGTRPALPS